MSGIPGSAVDRLRTFSKDRTELLKLLVEKESRQTRRIAPYPRARTDDTVQLPTSWAQQRLWFISQLEGAGGAAYHIPLTVRLQGALDEEALQKALNALVLRHEALRTVFVSVEGDCRQEIATTGRFALRRIDLSDQPETQRETQLRLQEKEEANERFDLRVGPLIRGRLLRMAPREHVLLLTMHHIVSDGWSLGVIIRELSELYRTNRHECATTLEPLSIQYADYVMWQRQWLGDGVVAGQLSYWCSRLQGAPPQLELPTDRPRPAVQSYRGETIGVVLDEPLTRDLRELAQRHEMTLFMVLYAAWAILLSRLSGQEDVVVGTPVANRRRPQLEGIVGLFVNTLVLRVTVQGDLRLEQLLGQVKEVTLGAFDHQDTPFEQVVEALQPQRSLSRNPLFQAMLVLQNTPQSALQLSGLDVTLEDGVSEPAKFDLSLSLQERGAGLVGSVNYAADLFDRETVQRWIVSFTVLLRGMRDSVQKRVADLQIIPERERSRIIGSFNDTRAEYPRHEMIHELFEAQVGRTPDALAVVHEGRSLTYAQLNGKANQVARYLRNRGVGPDQRVALCVERGLEMVVGLLGILKAGGAYVPLDPGYPVERLQYMLADAAPRVLLTQDKFRTLLPTTSQVSSLDGEWSEISKLGDSNQDPLELQLTSRHLAYVIYTSGSTGRPKGVMVEHAGVVNFLTCMQRILEVGPADCLLAVTTLSFDIAALEIYLPLISGAKVILARREAAADARLLGEMLGEHGVTVLQATPATWQLLLGGGWRGKADLKALCGGEALTRELSTELVGRVGALWNLYGPTETTIWSCARRIPTIPTTGAPLESIGRPIANTRIYVTDTLLRPVPIGVTGEIHIAGAGVARGYLNCPELMADRFLTDPFSADPRARLYKTGDLGRWRADGTLEYLGRNDHQVKIRGFRIELGEIEAQLARHEQVKEAVVLAREDVIGEKRLVAYVIPAHTRGTEVTLGVDVLRAHLQSAVPAYMMPSAFVMLERFPLTPNGKLDRNALPAPELGAYASRQYEAPQGEAEEILAGIWQDLLRVERVGRQDNFFELGGHSLLIVQMMERLRRVGLAAEVRSVFESQTLTDLARAVTSAGTEQSEVPPNRIPPGCEMITPEMLPLIALDAEQIERIVQSVPGGGANIQDIYPLTPPQDGILFHHLLSERFGDTYVVPTLLSVSSRTRVTELIAALQSVIDRHDILRTAVMWKELPRPVQVVYRNATLPVDEITLDRDRDVAEEIKTGLKPDLQRLDLTQAPLMRLRVAADRGTGRWYVLVLLHHIICDYVTAEVVVSEVVAHLKGHALALPESVPYRNHVAQALTYSATHDAEAFFRGKVGDVDEPTAPFGLFDVRGDGAQIEESRQELEPELTRRVRSQARRLGVSVATLFHAAWGLVVARTSGREDVVFGSVLLGRMQGSSGGKRIMGMFINTLPLRIRLQGVSARELVEQTQRELVDLLSHEQSSLAVAQRCSGIVGSAPLFSALLNYRHSAPNPEAEWDGAAGIEVLAVQERTNYPLSLLVDDSGEGLTLTAQTDRRVDPRRVTQYVRATMQSLLEALDRSPQTSALAMSILPQGEWQEVVEAFNATQVMYARDKFVHTLFEEQVERTPDAVAVTYEGRSLTYAGLNAEANQLGRYLRDRGVRPDQLVGICIERSLEMVVGLLGILKAGGAYVPLDPAYPPERLAYMLADAAPEVVLIGEAQRTKLPATTAVVIALDRDWSDIARQESDNLPVSTLGLNPDHLAYVIYTSGSTGQPKGAMNEHRGVVNRLQWMQDRYRLGEQDRVLQKTPFSFDVSVWEFFWTLLSGARLIVVPPEGHKDPAGLRKLMEQTGVTTAHFVPSMLQSFLDSHTPGECPSLRHVVCSGEELPAALQRKCFERLPQAELSNLYGPTEAAVDVTAWECRRDDLSARVPIGRPISNIRMYVLDKGGQPVPIGVTGEIYIAGVGVGRGYLKRPELTAEQFLKEPFRAAPQARMYRTGDLGRWRADGAIEYLGRNDHQVKIRGFRIELGEIETQLARHEGVKEAVVIAREDVPGEKRLVAYLIPKDSDTEVSLSAEALRTCLKAALPQHMVPSAFVILDRMPLSSNGKLDRRALPAPELGAYVRREFEAPRGEVEEILAEIWRALLRVEQVGRQDNFFELGGHSLLIVQMMERLRLSGLSAEVRRILESPTLADLASALISGADAQFVPPPNRIPPDCEAITPHMLSLVDLQAEQIERIVQSIPGGAANIQDIYPLAPLQEGLLFHYLLNEQGGDPYVVPTLLSVSSRDRLEELIAALQGVTDRHDVLRTAVLWEHLPRPVQVVCRQAIVPVEQIGLSRDRDALEQALEWVRPERQRLNLQKAPLIRLQIAADPHGDAWYVLLQLHHIAGDNTAREIVTSEVVAHLERRAQELPEPAPYRHHVAQALAYERTRDAAGFFRAKLGTVVEPTAPFGLVDVYGNGGQTAEAHQELEVGLATRVRVQARRLGVSAATLFHAAWSLVIARTSGRDDVVFGSVLLGRLQGNAGAQRILGMFINTLPLRLRLQGTTAKELVGQTQRELVELLSHEQASLSMAQRCSGIVGSAPLFSTLLNYRHSTPEPEVEWTRAEGIQVLAGQERTNYPITLSVDDLGEVFVLTAQTDRRIDPRRMMDYLHMAMSSLIDALESKPQTPALALSVLPANERHQVTELFNATRAAYPRERLIHELFEEQVEATPEALAVVYEGELLTYLELNEKANQLAHYLHRQGVGTGEYVPILMPRSLQMLVAQLAVLKNGAAYVPMDPRMPAERQAFMLRDCGARRILVDQNDDVGLRPESVDVVNCMRLAATLGALSRENLGVKPDSSSPAYVMYTSGSTGNPKGVIVSHRGVTRLAINNGYARIESADCIAHCSNPAFDASTFEIWAGLLNGARVLIVPRAVVLDSERLVELLAGCGVTVLWMTIGLFAQYTEALTPLFGQLRYLLVGGDVVEPEVVGRVLRHNPPLHLLSCYGPTECTTFSTTYLLEAVDAQTQSIPIGKPISNTQIYVLDSDLRPLPIGVTGEIYIGGEGVALGYLNRPEQTAERFVPDPFAGESGSRLYKSGDLGRWRADGNVEFLGRNDQQVKLRGFRIELGEIEAQLLRHREVKQAVVLAREDIPGEKQLVAYVTPAAQYSPGTDELRSHLLEVLPDYMVPGAFVVLDKLPLTVNGKLDRRALPAPELGAYASKQYEAPQGATEGVLAGIWQDLLRVERVGRRDNFFELGGHSLLGMKLIVKVAEAFRVKLSVATIFQHPSVQQMAKVLESLRVGSQSQQDPEELEFEEGVL